MKITYHRCTKHITVETEIGFIGVKLRAHRDQWHNLWNSIEKQTITFETVKAFLSKRTPLQTKALLKRLSLERPTIFEAGFVSAVTGSCGVNPLFKPARKPRNPGEYKLRWSEKHRISTQAAHLYSCLKQLAEVPKHYWPKHIKAALVTYGVREADLLSQMRIKEAVAAILSEYHGLKPPGEYPDRFWKTFVTELRPRFIDLPLPGQNDPVLGEIFTKSNI